MDFEPVGVESEGVGSLLRGVIPGGVAARGGDLGPDPQDGPGLEYFSIHDCATTHREEADEVGGVGFGTTLRWRRQ